MVGIDVVVQVDVDWCVLWVFDVIGLDYEVVVVFVGVGWEVDEVVFLVFDDVWCLDCFYVVGDCMVQWLLVYQVV